MRSVTTRKAKMTRKMTRAEILAICLSAGVITITFSTLQFQRNRLVDDLSDGSPETGLMHASDHTEGRPQHQLADAAPRSKRQLMLVTYGRTGSSFTSAMISRDPSVFYTNEPLHAMPSDIYDVNVTPNTQEKVFNTLDAFLTCDFKKLDPEMFRDELYASSPSTAPVFECLNNTAIGGYAHVRCFLSMWASCQGRPVSFVKTIRFRGEWAERFMRRYPNLKILFLVSETEEALGRKGQMPTWNSNNSCVDI